MKRNFFWAVIVSILQYGCTTWTLTKRLEKKLDGNYTRMLQAILNKSWRQHPTKQRLYDHLPPILKTIRDRRTRRAGHCWRSRDELISDVFLWTHSHGRAKAGDQLEPTYSYSLRILGAARRTCRTQWTIRKGGEGAVGYLCWWYDKIMMMMIYIYIFTSRTIPTIFVRSLFRVGTIDSIFLYSFSLDTSSTST